MLDKNNLPLVSGGIYSREGHTDLFYDLIVIDSVSENSLRVQDLAGHVEEFSGNGAVKYSSSLQLMDKDSLRRFSGEVQGRVSRLLEILA